MLYLNWDITLEPHSKHPSNTGFSFQALTWLQVSWYKIRQKLKSKTRKKKIKKTTRKNNTDNSWGKCQVNTNVPGERASQYWAVQLSQIYLVQFCITDDFRICLQIITCLLLNQHWLVSLKGVCSNIFCKSSLMWLFTRIRK